MTITLTDGGIETRIIYEFKHPIGDFESFELLEDESGRNILGQIYQSYADVAVRYGLPIQLGTPTWRASRKWTSAVMRVNAEAVELLREVAHRAAGTRIILAGVIGPASDGYAAREALKEDDAFAYHCEQAASPLSPDELDKLDHLAATDYQTWARDEIACAREFDLTILGGCCGTDQRFIEALAKEARVFP